MARLETRPIEIDRRYQLQNAFLSIRDPYDAIVELVTNADDRYEILDIDGKIEIEVQRQRGHRPTILRVRDFADGMTAQDMQEKLGRIGGRVSGLETGKKVRGTNSRGAKDVSALGKVTFEAIASDAHYHKCYIWRGEFTPYESTKASFEIRERCGIPNTGMLVTIEIDSGRKVPNHDNLVEGVSTLVVFRDLLQNPRRQVIVRDLNQSRNDVVLAPPFQGDVRVETALDIPGYQGAKAKLIIYRAPRQFNPDQQRFRKGGILIKSKHAIHEATLFDPRYDRDPHALWFYGKLSCPYIDDLWNAYDDKMDQGAVAEPHNPCPVIDPMRKHGLTKDHPFVKSLFEAALKELRPLVDQEQKRAEGQRSAIENRQTRQRLNKLERAAAQFMGEKQDGDEPAHKPNTVDTSIRLQERGYTLGPLFLQLAIGQFGRVWLNVKRDAFPQLQEGSSVQIQCLTNEISSDRCVCRLEQHPTQDGVLRASWSVKGQDVTSASGIRVRIGSVVEEVSIEVSASKAAKYKHIVGLAFSQKRFCIYADCGPRAVNLVAPLSLISKPTPFELTCSNSDFKINGPHVLKPIAKFGIARCTIRVEASKVDAIGKLVASVGGAEVSSDLLVVPPKGTGVKIKLEDIDLGTQRHRWRLNVLEIAARHPSLKKYLGRKSENFPGQDRKHFRILLAGIVADAVCGKIIERREMAHVYDEDVRDWSFFYAEYSRLMSEFLPYAHKLVLPEGGEFAS